MNSTVPENTSAETVVYRALASDPEGAPLTLSIAAGGDGARFTLNAAGELRFIAPPDHDLPRDGDQDNVYQLQIVAGDGVNETRRAITITVTNDREGRSLAFYCGGRGCGGVSRQVAAFSSGSVPGICCSVMVASEDGTVTQVYAIDDVGPTVTIPNVATDGERGILSMTPAPDFATSGVFYLMYTQSGGDIVVQRFPRLFVESAGRQGAPGPVVLRIPHPQYNNNLGGWIGFAPDGSLYVATGDGGGSGDPLNTAQDLDSRLGKVLRLSADFSTVTTVATGFRNPNGGSFYSGNLILADRGETSREELNIIPLTGPVRNYGWPYREGTLTVRSGGPSGMVDPLAECQHTSGSRGCYALVGGVVDTRGPSPSNHAYVFGDRNYVDPGTGANRGGLLFTLPASALVFGQPTIPASEFRSLTLDLFSGFPSSGIADPTSIYLDRALNSILVTQGRYVFVGLM